MSASDNGSRQERFQLMELMHAHVATLIDYGLLRRPSTCASCGSESVHIDGHHPSYAEPRAVIWLCHACHRAEHGRMDRLGVDAYSEIDVCETLDRIWRSRNRRRCQRCWESGHSQNHCDRPWSPMPVVLRGPVGVEDGPVDLEPVTRRLGGLLGQAAV